MSIRFTQRDSLRSVAALTALGFCPARTWAQPRAAVPARPQLSLGLNESAFGPSPQVTRALRSAASASRCRSTHSSPTTCRSCAPRSAHALAVLVAFARGERLRVITP